MATSPSCDHVRQEKDKNTTFTRQTVGATDLKPGMHAQFEFGRNVGLFLPGHTSFNWYGRLKMPKSGISEKTWTE